MKYAAFFIGLMTLFLPVYAEQNGESVPLTRLPFAWPSFTWDILWSGSWDEGRTVHNRGELRLGLADGGLTGRFQILDRRALDFRLDPPWGDPASGVGGVSFGMYHRATGSRLLYGVLDEWGLPARIRNPWARSSPFAENSKPVMADLRTSASSTKQAEAYLYLSSPRFTLLPEAALPEISVRGFASAQMSVRNELAPAFSGGLETFFGEKIDFRLEGFYTGWKLPPRDSGSWFSDPAPLPERDFRLGAAAVMLNTPFLSLSSDWAWSQTFAWGGGVYGNFAARFNPPLRGGSGKAGPWSVSVAADGSGERYVGRDGSAVGGGFRAAGRIERKGARGSFFRSGTVFRGPGLGEDFDRSSTNVYYRFAAPDKRAGESFPLRLSRVSLSADRNASDPKKINDSVDGVLGLSLYMPVVNLPGFSHKPGARRPQGFPLGINISSAVKWLGSAEEPLPLPLPYPGRRFDSAKIGCELLWSPGIFQFRTRWNYTVFEAKSPKDNLLDMSFNAAVRFKYGRFSIRVASPDFPDKWNCTVSWRLFAGNGE